MEPESIDAVTDQDVDTIANQVCAVGSTNPTEAWTWLSGWWGAGDADVAQQEQLARILAAVNARNAHLADLLMLEILQDVQPKLAGSSAGHLQGALDGLSTDERVELQQRMAAFIDVIRGIDAALAERYMAVSGDRSLASTVAQTRTPRELLVYFVELFVQHPERVAAEMADLAGETKDALIEELTGEEGFATILNYMGPEWVAFLLAGGTGLVISATDRQAIFIRSSVSPEAAASILGVDVVVENGTTAGILAGLVNSGEKDKVIRILELISLPQREKVLRGLFYLVVDDDVEAIRAGVAE